jgi:hypothetical protein
VEVSNSVNRWYRRSGSLSENGFLGVIILAIAMLWVGLYLWDRSRKPWKRTANDREGLFSQLCDLHNLSKRDRLLLINLAKAQKLDQPALAFVNPRILLAFAKNSPGMSAEVRSLVDRLFGEALVKEIVGQSVPLMASSEA